MNRPRRTWTGWLAGLGLSLIAFAAQAAGLSFSPVRVTLEDPGQIQNLRVRNTADEPLVVQAAVKDLSIADDRERYTDTDALVVTPPVFTIGPGEEQIVRLGLRNPAPVETERAFRVFFEQSPARPAASGEGEPVRVQVNLRVGIPVFVSPIRPLPRSIDWQMESLGDGVVRVSAVNRGNTHARLSRLSLLGEGGEVLAEADGLIYLLPGSRRSWMLKLPAGAARPHHLRFEDQRGSAEAALPPA